MEASALSMAAEAIDKNMIGMLLLSFVVTVVITAAASLPS